MDCREALKHLFDYVDGELVGSSKIEVESHFAICQGCQRRIDFERNWKAMLKEKLSVSKAPSELKARIRVQIEEETGVSQKRFALSTLFKPQLALAIAALVMILGIYFFGLRQTVPQIVAEFVEEHEEYIEEGAPQDITSTDPQEVEAFFRDKVDFKPHLSNFVQKDWQFLGGKLQNITGRKTAYLCLKKEGIWVSLYLLSDKGVSMPSLEIMTKKGKTFYVIKYKGYNCILWRGDGMFCGLVSELAVQTLIDYASAV